MKHGASDWEVEEGIAGLLGWPNFTQIVRAHTDCLPGWDSEGSETRTVR